MTKITKNNTLKEIKQELNKYRKLNDKIELQSLKTSKDTAIMYLTNEIEEYQDSLENELVSNIFDDEVKTELDHELAEIENLENDSAVLDDDEIMIPLPDKTEGTFELKTSNMTHEPVVSLSPVQEKVVQKSLVDLNKNKPRLNDITITDSEIFNLAEIDLEDKKSRKDQVLHIIQQFNTTTKVISERLGISRRNVSSILTYLRQDGYTIDTNKSGKECLIIFNHDIEKQETKTTVSKKSSVGRKQQLLNILENVEQSTMNELSQKLDVTRKNISSLLTYLRADGYIISTKRVSKETTVTLIKQ